MFISGRKRKRSMIVMASWAGRKFPFDFDRSVNFSQLLTKYRVKISPTWVGHIRIVWSSRNFHQLQSLKWWIVHRPTNSKIFSLKWWPHMMTSPDYTLKHQIVSRGSIPSGRISDYLAGSGDQGSVPSQHNFSWPQQISNVNSISRELAGSFSSNQGSMFSQQASPFTD
jgi:hypothetical protein